MTVLYFNELKPWHLGGGTALHINSECVGHCCIECVIFSVVLMSELILYSSLNVTFECQLPLLLFILLPCGYTWTSPLFQDFHVCVCMSLWDSSHGIC